MTRFVYPDLREGYVDLCQHVLRYGQVTSPRGQRTYELLGVTVEVEDLEDTLPVGVNRGVNLQFAALEALQLVGEVSRSDYLVAVRPEFARYLDEDGTQHGAYGLRAAGQVRRVLERFQHDPASRQGVVTIWDSDRDSHEVHADLPCTVALHLLPRGEKLHLNVYMRSNDVWLGLAYDYFVFSQWLLTIARFLGLEPGRYVHHASSLHLYDRDLEAVQRLYPPQEVGKRANRLPEGLDVEPFHRDLRLEWQAVLYHARNLLDRPDRHEVMGPNDQWYRAQLLRVHEKTRTEP